MKRTNVYTVAMAVILLTAIVGFAVRGSMMSMSKSPSEAS
jgi:hypothetical protein